VWHNRLAWIDLGAWLITGAELVARLGDSAFEVALAVLTILGLAGSIVWLGRRWRVAALIAALLYLGYYATRFFVLEVEPLLAIMSLPQAVADGFYVLWSSPMGRLSRGEVLDAAAELWREWLMPLVQLGVLAASRRSS
jgi:hypothetical protein